MRKCFVKGDSGWVEVMDGLEEDAMSNVVALMAQSPSRCARKARKGCGAGLEHFS
jgi:hypothetical protein